jgi:hypothetical protein
VSVEIYGLYDPDSGELRYVGKAKNASERLKRHILERHRSRPVNCWVRSLVLVGKAPKMLVLEVVPADRWEEAERRLIAEHRKIGKLLNVADGGAMPGTTPELRQKAARASNEKQRAAPPYVAAITTAKRKTGQLHRECLKKGWYLQAYKLRLVMKCSAAWRPDLYGCWASL